MVDETLLMICQPSFNVAQILRKHGILLISVAFVFSYGTTGLGLAKGRGSSSSLLTNKQSEVIRTERYSYHLRRRRRLRCTMICRTMFARPKTLRGWAAAQLTQGCVDTYAR